MQASWASSPREDAMYLRPPCCMRHIFADGSWIQSAPFSNRSDAVGLMLSTTGYLGTTPVDQMQPLTSFCATPPFELTLMPRKHLYLISKSSAYRSVDQRERVI